MKKQFVVIMAALIGTALFASSASAMDSEHSMLTGALYKALKAENLPTDTIGDLTLNEIVQLKLILNDDEMGGRRAAAMKILDKH